MKEVVDKSKFTELETIEAHVCPWSDRTCNNCYYMDHEYHGGYCDKHHTDTSPGKTCGDWVSE